MAQGGMPLFYPPEASSCLFASLPLARENATAHEILKGPFLSQKGQWFYGFFIFYG